MQDLINLASTNRNFNSLIRDNTLWEILLCRDFGLTPESAQSFLNAHSRRLSENIGYRDLYRIFHQGRVPPTLNPIPEDLAQAGLTENHLRGWRSFLHDYDGDVENFPEITEKNIALALKELILNRHIPPARAVASIIGLTAYQVDGIRVGLAPEEVYGLTYNGITLLYNKTFPPENEYPYVLARPQERVFIKYLADQETQHLNRYQKEALKTLNGDKYNVSPEEISHYLEINSFLSEDLLKTFPQLLQQHTNNVPEALRQLAGLHAIPNHVNAGLPEHQTPRPADGLTPTKAAVVPDVAPPEEPKRRDQTTGSPAHETPSPTAADRTSKAATVRISQTSGMKNIQNIHDKLVDLGYDVAWIDVHNNWKPGLPWNDDFKQPLEKLLELHNRDLPAALKQLSNLASLSHHHSNAVLHSNNKDDLNTIKLMSKQQAEAFVKLKESGKESGYDISPKDVLDYWVINLPWNKNFPQIISQVWNRYGEAAPLNLKFTQFLGLVTGHKDAQQTSQLLQKLPIARIINPDLNLSNEELWRSEPYGLTAKILDALGNPSKLTPAQEEFIRSGKLLEAYKHELNLLQIKFYMESGLDIDNVVSCPPELSIAWSGQYGLTVEHVKNWIKENNKWTEDHTNALRYLRSDSVPIDTAMELLQQHADAPDEIFKLDLSPYRPQPNSSDAQAPGQFQELNQAQRDALNHKQLKGKLTEEMLRKWILPKDPKGKDIPWNPSHTNAIVNLVTKKEYPPEEAMEMLNQKNPSQALQTAMKAQKYVDQTPKDAPPTGDIRKPQWTAAAVVEKGERLPEEKPVERKYNIE